MPKQVWPESSLQRDAWPPADKKLMMSVIMRMIRSLIQKDSHHSLDDEMYDQKFRP